MQQTRSPRAASRVIPGETPQQAAARLGLPCETVQTPHGCVIVVGRLSQAQIDAENRYWYQRELREAEEMPADCELTKETA